MSALTTFAMMNTMSMMNHSINNNRKHTSSVHAYSAETTTFTKSFDHIEYDVMKSKYSKVVIKTYKTRHGAENFCKKNNMDVSCVKSRMVK